LKEDVDEVVYLLRNDDSQLDVW